MTRYIDADAMAVNESEAYMKAQIQVDSLTRKINEVVHIKIQKLIADTETEDVQPVVHAHWIEKVITDEYGNKISCVSCSNCGNYEKQNNTYYKTSSRFCSACGAKMDGDEHDNG